MFSTGNCSSGVPALDVTNGKLKMKERIVSRGSPGISFSCYEVLFTESVLQITCVNVLQEFNFLSTRISGHVQMVDCRKLQ